MRPLRPRRMIDLYVWRRGQFLVVKSGGYADEMARVNVSEYEEDDPKARNGFDEGGYP